MQEIFNAISTIGFPIAAFVLVWWDGRKREDRINEESKIREDKLLVALQESTKAQTETSAAMRETAEAMTRLADAINSREV